MKWTFMLSVTAVTEFLFPFRENHHPLPPKGRERERRSLSQRFQTATTDDLWECGGGARREGRDEGICLLPLPCVQLKRRASLGCGFLVVFNFFTVNTRYLCNQEKNVIMKGPTRGWALGGHPAAPTCRPPTTLTLGPESLGSKLPTFGRGLGNRADSRQPRSPTLPPGPL